MVGCGNIDGKLKVIDLNSNKSILQTPSHHSSIVRDLAFSAESALMASVGDDQHLHIYDV